MSIITMSIITMSIITMSIINKYKTISKYNKHINKRLKNGKVQRYFKTWFYHLFSNVYLFIYNLVKFSVEL